jgi:hypothetical protein
MELSMSSSAPVRRTNASIFSRTTAAVPIAEHWSTSSSTVRNGAGRLS